MYLEAGRWNEESFNESHDSKRPEAEEEDNLELSDGHLDEPRPRQLYQMMPLVWLLPRRRSAMSSSRHVYACPLYRTQLRRGQLSTTVSILLHGFLLFASASHLYLLLQGHSTNYLLDVPLPIPHGTTADHWVKRGVALLCQLAD